MIYMCIFLTAVNTASPVAIATVWLPFWSSFTIRAVSLRTKQLNATNPQKIKFDSTSSRAKPLEAGEGMRNMNDMKRNE